MSQLIRRNFYGLTLSTLLLALCSSAAAQQPNKISRIGYLSDSSRSTNSAPREGFLQGLRELGYEEEKNIKIEYRYAEGTMGKLPELAAELVRLKVDAIFATGQQPTQAAKQATTSIPIIFPTAGDPVAFGLVDSLARPGGNLTGLTNFSPLLSGKRVELLREALPRISRVAVLRDPRQPLQSFEETKMAAQTLGVKIQSLEIRDAPDIERAFSSMRREKADALITLAQSVLTFHRRRILELAARYRMPSMHATKEWVEEGGLISYGPNTADLYRRAAAYVDKVLKGVKPSDLPVEQPKTFEFFINLNTAKQIGLTIPPNVLARADKVIK